MFFVVCTISLMVNIYSTGYMHGDSRFTWYFTVLNLFTGSMLLLVAAPNLLQCSWLGAGRRLPLPAHRVLVGEKRELRRRDQGVHHDPHR